MSEIETTIKIFNLTFVLMNVLLNSKIVSGKELIYIPGDISLGGLFPMHEQVLYIMIIIIITRAPKGAWKCYFPLFQKIMTDRAKL